MEECDIESNFLGLSTNPFDVMSYDMMPSTDKRQLRSNSRQVSPFNRIQSNFTFNQDDEESKIQHDTSLPV